MNYKNAALSTPSSKVCKKREKRLSDPALEKYVLTVVLDTINAFFSSPFSENSTSLQVPMGWILNPCPMFHSSLEPHTYRISHRGFHRDSWGTKSHLIVCGCTRLMNHASFLHPEGLMHGSPGCWQKGLGKSLRSKVSPTEGEAEYS